MSSIMVRLKGMAGFTQPQDVQLEQEKQELDQAIFSPEPVSLGALQSLYKALSIRPAPTLLNTLFLLAAKYPIPNSNPMDAIVLTSEDDTCFLTSRSLLAAHSSVFATAADIPSPISPTAEIESISLSSSTTASLGLILAVLTILGAGPQLRRAALKAEVEKYQPNFSAKDLITIGDAINCANAYEISSFVDHFVRPILGNLSGLEPVRGFTLLAMSARHARGPQSIYAGKMVVAGKSIPSQFYNILERYAPGHTNRYAHLCLFYPKAGTNLRADLRTRQPLTDNVKGVSRKYKEDFAKQCRGAEWSKFDDASRQVNSHRHFRPACAAFRLGKQWVDLRRKAADAVFAKVAKNGEGPTNYATILPIVQQSVPCAKCASRLARTFEVAVKKFRGSAFRYHEMGAAVETKS